MDLHLANSLQASALTAYRSPLTASPYTVYRSPFTVSDSSMRRCLAVAILFCVPASLTAQGPDSHSQRLHGTYTAGPTAITFDSAATTGSREAIRLPSPVAMSRPVTR